MRHDARLTVDQSHRMFQSGALSETDPIELLDGWLVPKIYKNPPHTAGTDLVRQSLAGIVPQGWYVRSQDPITLARSEPEPDAAVVLGDTRRYTDRHPGPDEVSLVVEVADASLRQDQTLQLAIYAEAGIPVYWILNLVDRRLEVYTDPSGPSDAPQYRQRHEYSPSEKVTVAIAGQEAGQVTVGELLP